MSDIFRRCILLAAIFSLPFSSYALPGRWENELSGEGWRLWLDENAEWKNDPVYMPPVDISLLPEKPPSCGWDDLERLSDKSVSVPGTVEEYFWGANGNPIGIAGDYRGVSWWSRTFELDSSLKGKRIALAFDSVNLRAEIFVNRTLAGYDVIGSTPFEIDITEFVRFGGMNTLDIRITDPVGNFDWNDNDMYRWGENDVPAVHGFGGITGRVFLRATDKIRITDVYVENKPKRKEAEVFVTLANETGQKINGELFLAIAEWKNPREVVWKKSIRISVPPEGMDASFYVKAGTAKVWTPDSPDLYIAATAFKSADNAIVDSMNRRFGFRWFDVGEKNGDRRFYLNGKRAFLICAMTRGYWPKNGIFPTPAMIDREMQVMRDLGYNTMLFHRAVGQEYVTDACDETGFLVYEEPGGYPCKPTPNETSLLWRREKLRRMVLRDRSHPSLVICNLVNEATVPPSEDDIANLKMVHELDPGRIVTYNSDKNRDPGFGYGSRVENDPYKMHILPFSKEFSYAWFDHHHWFRYPGYVDECYNNPRFYLRGVINDSGGISPADSLKTLDPGEIIFWGEEGQWGTMMRLGRIKDELDRTGADGWRERELLSWHESYDRYLDESGFREVFPTVDDFTLSLGRSLHYFHGRIIENVRISNIADGYNLNGWAAPVTAEDIADVYRYPTADPSILARYTRPLYVAVKIRDKVLPSGTKSVADIYIVNEKDLSGKHTLTLTLHSFAGDALFEKNFDVTVFGGEEYGQLLIENVVLPAPPAPGYYTIDARLTANDEVKATGSDELFYVDFMSGSGITGVGAVADTTGIVNTFLKEARGTTLQAFDPEGPDPDFIVLGPHDFNALGQASYRGRYINALMDRVANGTTLIILDQADRWAGEVMDNLFRHPAVTYKRSVSWGTDGRFFCNKHPSLEGLPQAQGMNWEYQALYRGEIKGLDIGLDGIEPIIGLACENRRDIATALCIVPFGSGRVILSTLPIVPELASKRPQSAVVKKLFLNLIDLPEQENVWKR